MATPRHDSSRRHRLLPILTRDRVLVYGVWAVLGLLAWSLPPDALRDIGWSLVWSLTAAALVGLWLQGGRVAPPTRRAWLLDGTLRYPIGIALTLPALAFVATLPVLAPEVASRPETLLASMGSSALALWLGVGQTRRLVGLSTTVSSGSHSRRLRTRWLNAVADAVERGLGRVEVDSDRGACDLAWASREVHEGLGADAHILLRAGDVRIQIFERVVQVWHRSHRLRLDVETDIVAGLPDGVRLELEAPDRYLLQLRARRDEAALADLGLATARVAAALVGHARLADDVEPLQGREPPARLARRLVVRSDTGAVFTVSGDQLQARADGHTKARAVASIDLSRPFRLLLGSEVASSRAALAVTVRQRLDAPGDGAPGDGLTLGSRAEGHGWTEVRFAVELSALPASLVAALPDEQVGREAFVDGLAFQALWRLLYWRAVEHGESVCSLPQLRFGARRSLDSGLRVADTMAPRRLGLGGAVRTVATLALGAFLVAHLMVAVASTDLGFPVWEPASVRQIVGLLVALVALGLLNLLGVGRRRLDDVVTDGLRAGLDVMLAIDPAIDRGVVSMRVPDTEASIGALASSGCRVDGVLQADGALWGRLSVWCAERWLGIPVIRQQLEIHVDTQRDGGARLAGELARLQMRLLDSGVAAVLVRAGLRATLAISTRDRLGSHHAPWSRVVSHIRRLQADEGYNPACADRGAVRPMWPTPPRSVGAFRGAAGVGLGAWCAAAAAVALAALFAHSLPVIDVADHPVARVDTPDLAMLTACPPARGGRVERLDSLRCVVNAAGYRGTLRDASPQRVLPLVDEMWAPPGGHIVSAGMPRHQRERWFNFLHAAEAKQAAPLGVAMAAQGIEGWAEYHDRLATHVMAQLRPPTVFDDLEVASPGAARVASDASPIEALGDSVVTRIEHDWMRIESVISGADGDQTRPLFVSTAPLAEQPLVTRGLESTPGSRDGDVVGLCWRADSDEARAACLCSALGGSLPAYHLRERILRGWPRGRAPGAIVVEHPELGVARCGPSHCERLGADYLDALYCTIDPLEHLTRSTGRYGRR